MTSNKIAGVEIIQPSPIVAEVDRKLYELLHDIDILSVVTPTNYQEQKTFFFDNHYSVAPQFVYRRENIDAFLIKRELFNLPVDKIENDDLRSLYIDVIDSYVDKIDQFDSIGSHKFLYDSLRYYGEPTEKDIRNAQFILHIPEGFEDENQTILNATDIAKLFKRFSRKHQYDYHLSIDDKLIANALVFGSNVKINQAALISSKDAMALAHHELGVHLLTSLNAQAQPLKVFQLGCPVNTKTQEGLAILSEYLAGCLTINRLKVLALRVVAVASLIKDKNFRHTFLLLKEQYQIDDEQAFKITSRVYRGGGFTKDYLYLQGFHEILNAYENSQDFNNLLIGKTSYSYLPIITKLINTGILYPPLKITPSFCTPNQNSEVYKFISHAIK